MRKILKTAAIACAALTGSSAFAQSATDLANDAAEPSNVLTYGMGYNLQRYSSLSQINKSNVSKLVPVWALDMENDFGEIGQPIVKDGVVYAADLNWTVAVDGVTGKMLWRTDAKVNPESMRVACCGATNRGVALYDGLLYRGTLDAFIVALDQKTGKEAWRTQVADWKDSYTITSAPLVANGVVITGMAGADYGVRGFLDGYDPKTGKQLWRRYMTAGPGDKGADSWENPEAYQRGGGSTWITGSYDPDLDLVYWGTGNAGPYRKRGDALNTASVVALHPRTGEIAWSYQFTPSDAYDYDAVWEMILADIKFDGRVRKVILHMDKNGFLYVLDRANGKLLAANAYARVNWATAIDMKTGRPVETGLREKLFAGERISIWPSLAGAKNWQHAAYSPKTGLLYANTLEMYTEYEMSPTVPSRTSMGIRNLKFLFEDGKPKAHMEAIDPLTGKAKWRIPFDTTLGSSMLATGSGLLFTGLHTREFIALDAANGKQLWSFPVSSGINSSPITWSFKGKQYVTVLAGLGGFNSRLMGDQRKTVPVGGSLWTFALPK